jgi:hypothetical protein
MRISSDSFMMTLAPCTMPINLLQPSISKLSLSWNSHPCPLQVSTQKKNHDNDTDNAANETGTRMGEASGATTTPGETNNDD